MKIFKQASVENELASGMEKFQAEYFFNTDTLIEQKKLKALAYLNDAAKYLDNAGLEKEAIIVTKFIEKIAQDPKKTREQADIDLAKIRFEQEKQQKEKLKKEKEDDFSMWLAEKAKERLALKSVPLGEKLPEHLSPEYQKKQESKLRSPEKTKKPPQERASKPSTFIKFDPSALTLPEGKSRRQFFLEQRINALESEIKQYDPAQIEILKQIELPKDKKITDYTPEERNILNIKNISTNIEKTKQELIAELAQSKENAGKSPRQIFLEQKLRQSKLEPIDRTMTEKELANIKSRPVSSTERTEIKEGPGRYITKDDLAGSRFENIKKIKELGMKEITVDDALSILRKHFRLSLPLPNSTTKIFRKKIETTQPKEIMVTKMLPSGKLKHVPQLVPDPQGKNVNEYYVDETVSGSYFDGKFIKDDPVQRQKYFDEWKLGINYLNSILKGNPNESLFKPKSTDLPPERYYTEKEELEPTPAMSTGNKPDWVMKVAQVDDLATVLNEHAKYVGRELKSLGFTGVNDFAGRSLYPTKKDKAEQEMEKGEIRADKEKELLQDDVENEDIINYIEYATDRKLKEDEVNSTLNDMTSITREDPITGQALKKEFDPIRFGQYKNIYTTMKGYKDANPGTGEGSELERFTKALTQKINRMEKRLEEGVSKEDRELLEKELDRTEKSLELSERALAQSRTVKRKPLPYDQSEEGRAILKRYENEPQEPAFVQEPKLDPETEYRHNIKMPEVTKIRGL